MIAAAWSLTLQGISFVSIPLLSDRKEQEKTQWNKRVAIHILRERSPLSSPELAVLKLAI